MSNRAPFRVIAGLAALAAVTVVDAAAAGDKAQKRVVVLPPAEGPAERLPAHPRVRVEAAPLAGSTAAPRATTAESPPRACAGNKVRLTECLELAARIDRFLSERSLRAAGAAPTAGDVCRKGGGHAPGCPAVVAQIAAWLKTRQTAAAVPPLADAAANER